MTTSTRRWGGTFTLASGDDRGLTLACRSSLAMCTASSSEEKGPTVIQIEKKRYAVKVLATFCSRIPKVTMALLEFFIEREKALPHRHRLPHFCQEKSVLAAQPCLQRLHQRIIPHQDIRDMVKNLMELHRECLKQAPSTAHSFGLVIHKLIIIVSDLATSLERISKVPVTDWMAVCGALTPRTEEMQNNGNHPAYQRSGNNRYNNQPKPMSGSMAGGAANQTSEMATDGGGAHRLAQQQQQQQQQQQKTRPEPQPQAAQPRPSPPNGGAMAHTHPRMRLKEEQDPSDFIPTTRQREDMKLLSAVGATPRKSSKPRPTVSAGSTPVNPGANTAQRPKPRRSSRNRRPPQRLPYNENFSNVG